ncbi:IS630 family transposase [Streptosporangium subroseum]|uniref:IS630 family transposase n=1 Tax=Streptosporangium subroseum TaxID=106412 RepID=UPI003439C0CD
MARKGRRATFEEKGFALRLLEQGMSPDRVADALGVGRESVFRWKRQARADGIEALRIKKAPGGPRRLTPGQEQTIKVVVRDVTPRQVLGTAVVLWTRTLVAMVIAAWFGIGLSVAAAGRLLRELGMSPQRPAYRAPQRDPAAITRWTTVLFPAIRRWARTRGAVVLFVDEMSMRVDHRCGTTWGPIGQTPVVRAGAGRRSVKMFSAVGADGTLRYRLGHGSMDRWAFIGFCAQLLRTITRPIFLIVDGSSVHTARAVGDFVARTGGRLRLFFLPAYAPDLNPDEWVNQNVKARVAREAVADEHELAAAMHRSMHRLRSLAFSGHVPVQRTPSGKVSTARFGGIPLRRRKHARRPRRSRAPQLSRTRAPVCGKPAALGPRCYLPRRLIPAQDWYRTASPGQLPQCERTRGTAGGRTWTCCSTDSGSPGTRPSSPRSCGHRRGRPCGKGSEQPWPHDRLGVAGVGQWSGAIGAAGPPLSRSAVRPPGFPMSASQHSYVRPSAQRCPPTSASSCPLTRNLAINTFHLDGRANIAHARRDLLNHNDAFAVHGI